MPINRKAQPGAQPALQIRKQRQLVYETLALHDPANCAGHLSLARLRDRCAYG